MQITITPEQRALMVWHVAMDASCLEGIEKDFDSGNRAEVYRLRDKFNLALEMREMLGWEDALAEDTTITFDDTDAVLMRWLVDVRSYFEQQIGALTVQLAQQEPGVEDSYYYGGQEASIAQTHEYIARERDQALLVQGMVDSIREQRLVVA